MAKKIENLVEKEKLREDLGFGTQATSNDARLINPNGDFNVVKIGQSFESRLNLYHRLITMHWASLGGLIILFYFFLNLIFASIYYGLGIEHLHGTQQDSGLSAFWEAFFFSSQTLTTVGYGQISPAGYWASMVAAIEALLGLMSFAIMTGLLYGRFSRPSPKIRFSKKAIIGPYLDINALMLRVINEKSNQLFNVEASVILSRNEVKNKKVIRRYYALDLERSKVKFFPMSWTIVHPITKNSPLWGQTAETLAKSDSEFLIAIEGINDTYADHHYSRKSFLYDELIWGAKFEPLLNTDGDKYTVDLNTIDKCVKAELNDV